MLAGLGMAPFEAAAICLLANTAPVAFGAIGTPIVGLQSVTSLPIGDLSADVGRLCAPLALIVPVYVIAVMGGRKGLKQAGLAALVCGAVFAVTQFLVSSYIGPYLTAILSSISAIGAMVVICLLRRKTSDGNPAGQRHSAGAMLLAWSPYIFLVIFVLLLNGDQIVLPKPFDVLWPTCEAGRAEGVPESRHVGVRMAGSAQSGPEDAAGGEGAVAVRGQLHLQPSHHQRHGRAVRRVRLRPRSARFAAQAGAVHLADDEAARAADPHHRQRAGAGLPDELLGRHGDAGI